MGKEQKLSENILKVGISRNRSELLSEKFERAYLLFKPPQQK